MVSVKVVVRGGCIAGPGRHGPAARDGCAGRTEGEEPGPVAAGATEQPTALHRHPRPRREGEEQDFLPRREARERKGRRRR